MGVAGRANPPGEPWLPKWRRALSCVRKNTRREPCATGSPSVGRRRHLWGNESQMASANPRVPRAGIHLLTRLLTNQRIAPVGIPHGCRWRPTDGTAEYRLGLFENTRDRTCYGAEQPTQDSFDQPPTTHNQQPTTFHPPPTINPAIRRPPSTPLPGGFLPCQTTRSAENVD